MLGGNFGGNMSPSSSDSSDSEDDYLDGIRLTMPQSVESTPTGKHKGSSKTVKEAARRQLDDSYEEKETAAEVAARYRERESKKASSNPATPIIPGKQKEQQQHSAHHSRPPQSSLESASHVISQPSEPNRPPARGHAPRTAEEMSSSSSDDEPPRLALREPSPARKAISSHSKPAEGTDDKQSRPSPDGDRTGPTPARAESHSPPLGSPPPGGKTLQGGEIVPEEKSAVDEGLVQQKAAVVVSDGHQGGGAAVEQHVSPRQAPREEEDVLLSRMGQLLDRIDGLEKKVREQDELLRRQHAQISEQLAISKASQVVQSNPKCCTVS